MGLTKRLRRVVVDLHVNSLEDSDDEGKSPNISPTQNPMIVQIRELLTSLQGEHPGLPLDWASSRQAELTATGSEGLAHATRVLSQIRKDIAGATEAVKGNAPAVPTLTNLNAAESDVPAVPTTISATSDSSGSAGSGTTTTNNENEAPANMYEEQQHTGHRSNELPDIKHECNQEESKELRRTFCVLSESRFGVENDASYGNNSNPCANISCLEGIAATPLKAYRPPFETSAYETALQIADDCGTLSSSQAESSVRDAYARSHPPASPPPSSAAPLNKLVQCQANVPPSTPTPFAGRFVPQPTSYPNFPPVQPFSNDIPAKNSDINGVAFGVESQISEVAMSDYSTNYGCDLSEFGESQFSFAQGASASTQETFGASGFTQDYGCIRAVYAINAPGDSYDDQSIEEEPRINRTDRVPAPNLVTATAPINSSLSNKMWAQQVVANLNQQQSIVPPQEIEPKIARGTKVCDTTSFSDNAACRTLDETVAIGNLKEEDDNITSATARNQQEETTTDTTSTAAASESMFDAAPDASLSNLAKKRDTEAGLELAGRRARQKMRQKKLARARKKRDAEEKKGRLKALQIEAKKLRGRAAADKPRLPHRRLRLRSRRKGENAHGKKQGPQVTAKTEDLDRIQEAKRKTLQRLREKRRKLRESEARQRKLETEKANEKWRVRDAKLALDQQRRLQRRRFLEAERKAAARQMAEKAKILAKVNSLRNPASILKISTQSNDVQIKESAQSKPDQNRLQQGLRPKRKVREQQAVPPPATRALDTNSLEADVSAVYEDVEAWVKSVYGGNGPSKIQTIAPFMDDNDNDRENMSVSGNSIKNNNNKINSSEIHTYSGKAVSGQDCQRYAHHQYDDSQHQQEADDQAFLDAILQATE